MNERDLEEHFQRGVRLAVRLAEEKRRQLAVPATMPTGPIIGHDLTGAPLYAKLERGPLARPGQGMAKPRVRQVGLYEHAETLFEAQAEERDHGHR